MTDEATRLAAAIQNVRASAYAVREGAPRVWPSAAPFFDGLSMLAEHFADMAEKHLATLPKEKPAMDEAAKIREAVKAVRGLADPAKVRYWNTEVVCNAAEAHADYLNPSVCKTKTVEVWHVEYACNSVACIMAYSTREAADKWVSTPHCGADISCIRVTGPHRQMVLA